MKKTILRSGVIVAMLLSGISSYAQNIYTYAGINGTTGYTGDDSLATLARISGPAGIVINASGTYFADSRNNVIRKISPAGIITTIAGNGTGGYT